MNEQQILRDLYIRELGELNIRFWESADPAAALPAVESRTLRLIAEIKSVLDDETLDDPECFHRIERIVNALAAGGVSTTRHDWG